MLSDPRPPHQPWATPSAWGSLCRDSLPWLGHRSGRDTFTIPTPSPVAGAWGCSGRLPGGHHAPHTWAPGCRDMFPTSLLDISKGGAQTLTSYPGSPRGPGGPLAGYTAERTVRPRQTLPGSPRAGREGGGAHTHLALEGAALPEEGQSDTSESRGAAATPPMPAGTQRAGLGAQLGGGGQW